ncbi:hypothetical protein BJ684DRAFT_15762 [Piptocephalis cylindrospora]|uniref:Uncharacterized protein n=1 Tax=Piptocephalis cylindrospora TaxID=1907219 RepID=A0A4P9Y4Z4_9FUNG|nr:hypothetical protein BJ684DRAFT_15762 [Piptocephalis cylindrospora]|eukprot:RKP13874.1 hypothetical protein BJ684DRAFT_15762 [Piptocephalis cylindrospora]
MKVTALIFVVACLAAHPIVAPSPGHASVPGGGAKPVVVHPALKQYEPQLASHDDPNVPFHVYSKPSPGKNTITNKEPEKVTVGNTEKRKTNTKVTQNRQPDNVTPEQQQNVKKFNTHLARATRRLDDIEKDPSLAAKMSMDYIRKSLDKARLALDDAKPLGNPKQLSEMNLKLDKAFGRSRIAKDKLQTESQRQTNPQAAPRSVNGRTDTTKLDIDKPTGSRSKITDISDLTDAEQDSLIKIIFNENVGALGSKMIIALPTSTERNNAFKADPLIKDLNDSEKSRLFKQLIQSMPDELFPGDRYYPLVMDKPNTNSQKSGATLKDQNQGMTLPKARPDNRDEESGEGIPIFHSLIMHSSILMSPRFRIDWEHNKLINEEWKVARKLPATDQISVKREAEKKRNELLIEYSKITSESSALATAHAEVKYAKFSDDIMRMRNQDPNLSKILDPIENAVKNARKIAITPPMELPTTPTKTSRFNKLLGKTKRAFGITKVSYFQMMVAAP